MQDDLKQTVAVLVEAQKLIKAMSIDQRMALGKALASELRQANMLQRFEVRTTRKVGWTVEAHPMDLHVDTSCRFDDDVPF